jgi:cellobiose phosphorylase
VYSSGPGIYVALVVSRLLGLRIEFGNLIIDPVLSRSLDGLEARLRIVGRPVVFAYHVQGQGFGPRALSISGKAAPFDSESNAYRRGGAVMPSNASPPCSKQPTTAWRSTSRPPGTGSSRCRLTRRA